MTTLDERRGWLREAFTRLKALPSGSAAHSALRAVIDARLVEWQKEAAAAAGKEAPP